MFPRASGSKRTIDRAYICRRLRGYLRCGRQTAKHPRAQPLDEYAATTRRAGWLARATTSVASRAWPTKPEAAGASSSTRQRPSGAHIEPAGVGVTDGRVTFRDAVGRVVAEATLDPPQGLPRWTGPAGEAVDCRPQRDREAWQNCFERQSRLTARWAPQVRDARVCVGNCTVDRVPVARRSSTDWWLWRVPLPHVGGTPRAYYALELHLDSARCVAVTAP